MAGVASSVDFDRVVLTEQSFDLEKLAAAYGWEYRRVENRGQLDEKLTPGDKPTIVEVALPR